MASNLNRKIKLKRENFEFFALVVVCVWYAVLLRPSVPTGWAMRCIRQHGGCWHALPTSGVGVGRVGQRLPSPTPRSLPLPGLRPSFLPARVGCPAPTSAALSFPRVSAVRSGRRSPRPHRRRGSSSGPPANCFPHVIPHHPAELPTRSTLRCPLLPSSWKCFSIRCSNVFASPAAWTRRGHRHDSCGLSSLQWGHPTVQTGERFHFLVRGTFLTHLSAVRATLPPSRMDSQRLRTSGKMSSQGNRLNISVTFERSRASLGWNCVGGRRVTCERSQLVRPIPLLFIFLIPHADALFSHSKKKSAQPMYRAAYPNRSRTSVAVTAVSLISSTATCKVFKSLF